MDPIPLWSLIPLLQVGPQLDESLNSTEEQHTEWWEHVVHGKASPMEREHGSKETYQDGSPRVSRIAKCDNSLIAY